MRIRIRFDTLDLRRIYKASDRLVVRANKFSEGIPSESAAEYVAAVRRALSFSKYAIKYNKRYRDWKVKNVGHLKPRLLGGDLIDNLSRTRLAKGVYLGGVQAGIFDRGGKSWFTDTTSGKRYGKPKEIAMYGRAVEKLYPLFVPELEKFRKRWNIKLQKASNHLRRAWR